MFRLRNIAAVGIVIIALAAMAAFATRAPGPLPPVAERGVLDLSQWNFANGSAPLRGEWLYFDRQWAPHADEARIAQVPGPWPVESGALGQPRVDGFGTYRLKLMLPKAAEGEKPIIEIGYTLSAYRLWINGKVVAKSGVPAETAADEEARAYSLLAALPEGVREVTIDLEVSNHVALYGGTFIAPSVGYESQIVSHRYMVETTALVLVGAMFFGALYHFSIFFLTRAATASVPFGFFALLLGVRTLLIEPLASNAVPFIGQDWVWRLDYAATILLMPAAFWFFNSSFPKFFTRRVFEPIIFVCGALAAVNVLFGPAVGEYAVKAYELIALGLLFYFSIAFVLAVRGGERGAGLALAGWTVSALTVVHDILLDHGLISGINMIPFGFITFFLCLSGTLVARFHSDFRRAEELSRRLKSVNEGLEVMVQDRTHLLQTKVSELETRENELTQAKIVAQTANAAKSSFLATMSHELRTPLNAILGFSELIASESYGQAGDPRYVEYAQIINDSGKHLLSLISDVLDLSKIEAGKMELHAEPLDLDEVIADAVRLAGSKERLSTCRVTIDVPPAMPLLEADRRAVVQMLVNLVSNAKKFTPTEGTVIVSTYVEHGSVFIAVTDTGIGMSAEDIPKALAMFSQLDNGLSRKHEGTGLGLPIVKSLMQLHGGSLKLESELGKGTMAELRFPAARTRSRLKGASAA